MPDDNTPIDGEFGLDYQIFILRKMISQLPNDVTEHLDEQVDTVVEAIKARFDIVRKSIKDNLDDATLAVKMLEFDLQATKQERDALQDRLDDL
jgi:hypothetical protein